tara:strand:- start:333 stop:530 length:198 start_codon:yes stop_codon:yes gene_type:complete
MSDERMNKHPEFLQETMFQDHGTKVLITNPKSDVYLNASKDETRPNSDRIKEKYSQWREDVNLDN